MAKTLAALDNTSAFIYTLVITVLLRIIMNKNKLHITLQHNTKPYAFKQSEHQNYIT